LAWQARWLRHLAKNEQILEGLAPVFKPMASVGRLKGICKDACRLAGAVQRTFPSDMLRDQNAAYLRGVAIWGWVKTLVPSEPQNSW